MIDRRSFISSVAVAVLTAPLSVEGQQRNVPRVGVISAVTYEAQAPWSDGFREGLHSLGYVDGQNITIEWRYADGRAERFQELADDLVRLKVDVIVAANHPGMEAALRATKTIPIVVVLMIDDPVRRGLVTSLARPGGNITGVWPQTTEIIAKRLQLLQEAVPKISRVALLWDPAFAGIQEQVRETQVTAQALGMQLQLVEARSPSDFDRAFAAMKQQGAQATFILGSSMHYLHRVRIAELAKEGHLASGCLLREFAEAGCLMSYAPSFKDLWRHSTVYVDKILRGAKPGDLPIEQPTKFEFVINMRTAKALGLTIPQSLLLRADQVLE